MGQRIYRERDDHPGDDHQAEQWCKTYHRPRLPRITGGAGGSDEYTRQVAPEYVPERVPMPAVFAADGRPTETRASSDLERCPRCDLVELDPWAVHIAHDQGCEGSGWCCCDEVCEGCCTDCNPLEAL